MTGMTVHKTSMSELWDVREGLGFAFALNFIITYINSAVTKRVMPSIIGKRNKSWNQVISAMLGVAAF